MGYFLICSGSRRRGAFANNVSALTNLWNKPYINYKPACIYSNLSTTALAPADNRGIICKMSDKLATEGFVKESVIKWLSKNGWGHFVFDELHTHGVDLRAKKMNYDRYIFIEAKGQSASRSGSENSFVYSLGQIITRMKDGGSTRNYYGLALPSEAAQIAVRRIPWQIAKKTLIVCFFCNCGR